MQMSMLQMAAVRRLVAEVEVEIDWGQVANAANADVLLKSNVPMPLDVYVPMSPATLCPWLMPLVKHAISQATRASPPKAFAHRALSIQ